MREARPNRTLAQALGPIRARLADRARQLRKARRLISRPTWRRALLQGVAATIEHRRLAEFGDIRTVIDIGANKGQFALFALEAFPAARIHAFEPLPGPAATFRRVLGAQPRVRLTEVAVSPRAGLAEIHLVSREDSSSLLPATDALSRVFPDVSGTGRTLTVRSAPLDELLRPEDLEPPALLKIDVQGYELEVLRAAERLLPAIEFVYVECSYVRLYEGQALKADIADLLARAGFVEEFECNLMCSPSGQPVQSDCLFRRASGRPTGVAPR